MNKRNSIFVACLLGVVAALAFAAEDLQMPAPKRAEQPASPLRLSLSSLTPEQPGVFRVKLVKLGDAVARLQDEKKYLTIHSSGRAKRRPAAEFYR